MINLRLGEILNKLHYRYDNTKMMKRNQQIEDKMNIEENQQIVLDTCSNSSKKFNRFEYRIFR